MMLPNVVCGMYAFTWYMTSNNKYTQNKETAMYEIHTRFVEDRTGREICSLCCYQNSNKEPLTSGEGNTLAEALVVLRKNINNQKIKG